eukprot:c12368_g2_i1.p1 GENE.c12368_g2_i1~~c12368_g2_i1.p1  ORF type:complete len:252 (+),score=35.68 c12368_g2_i1:100-855(+)
MNVAGAGRRLVAALRLQGSQGSTRAMSLAMMPRAGLTTSARLMVPTLVCRTIPFRAFSSSNDKGGSGSGSGEGGGSAGTVKEDKPNDDELSDAEVDMPPLIPLVPLRPSRKARKTKSTMVKGEKEHDKEKEKEKEKAKQWFNVPVFYNSVRCKEEDVERALASSMFETWKENMKANVNIFTTCLKIDSVVYIPQTHVSDDMQTHHKTQQPQHSHTHTTAPRKPVTHVDLYLASASNQVRENVGHCVHKRVI